MSARQQFQFPATSPQPPTFSPDPENPLHAASEKVMNDPVPSTPTNTGGLAAIMNRKRSHPALEMGSAHMNPLARPGTADPYSQGRSSNFAKSQMLVMAPNPQAPRSSPLLSRDINYKMNAGFKFPSMWEPYAKARNTGGNDAHIATHDGTSPLKNDREMLSMPDSTTIPVPNPKFNPIALDAGARRVPINESSQNMNDEKNYAGGPVLPDHEITKDGRFKASNSLKRMRDEVDDDGDNEPPIKRLKNNQNDFTNTNLDMHLREFSPHTAERPSSGLSHSDHYRANGSAAGGPPHFAAQRQRFSRSPSTTHKSTPSPYQPQPIMRQQEPGGFTKLLGQDPDIFVQENLAEYEEMVKRWSECTFEEWIAGADEIMSHYTAIFDMVKERVRVKLRLYGNIHENIDKHNALLRERSETLTATKKQLVEEGGSVLKR